MLSQFRALTCIALFGMSTGLGLSSTASASACGSVASPTACSVTTANDVTFSVSNFALPNSVATGGASTYQPGDILIDILAEDTGTVVLRFSRNTQGPTPGVVFSANAGQTTGFILTYLVTATAAAPGTVDIIDPIEVSLGLHSSAGNGFGAVQMIVPGGPGACQATTVTPSDICPGLPGNITTTTNPGDILALSGNSGNVSILSFENEFNVSFTPTAVPTAASLPLLMIGLLGLRVARRR